MKSGRCCFLCAVSRNSLLSVRFNSEIWNKTRFFPGEKEKLASHAIAPMKSVEENTKPKQAYLGARFVPFLKNFNLDCNWQKLKYQP